MANDNLPGFISALLQSDIYDHPAENIKLVQTHISFVLLAGDFVYKFKKPVDFGFLDFSTLEKRQYCCEQELILNRRLCPEIYLGLVTITREGDGFALNGSGEVVEYGVKMARMPEDRMMVNLIRTGQVAREQIDALVDVLVPFYRQADRSEEIDGFGTAESVAVNVLENFEQTESFIGGGAVSREQFERISAWAKKFLARKQLFSDRIQGGYIRDCHGDLYSANICLADKVYIYDCIEFNRRFRYCDVASDIAFLAMDLDFTACRSCPITVLLSLVSARVIAVCRKCLIFINATGRMCAVRSGCLQQVILPWMRRLKRAAWKRRQNISNWRKAIYNICS